MLSKLVVLKCFIIAVYLVNVESQICEKKEIVTVNVNETFRVTDYVTYLKQPCSDRLKCVHRRRRRVTKYRTVTKSQLANVKHCCSGYTRIDASTNDSAIECAPICMPSCNKGFCESPAHCACHPGYVSDPVDSHNCLPVCKQPCTNGLCVEPNKCRCNFGYTLVNSSCQPLCTEPCHNGTCVSPETCECHAGYRKSERNTCEPYCLNGCENGACIAPEECNCNPGYRLTEIERLGNKICKPFCSKNCTNGVCIAPEECQCRPSYRMSENHLCEPACGDGWILKDHKCVAECKKSCGNGTCTSPNVCVCYPGYRIDFARLLSSGTIDAALCVPSCTNCDGNCVAPNVCERISTTAGTSTSTTTTTTIREVMNITFDDFELRYSTQNSGYVTFYDEPINSTIVYEDDLESATASSWIADNWVPVFAVIMCVVAAALLLFAVFRFTPVLEYFKGKSYVVKNGPQESETRIDDSYRFEDLKIRFSNDNKT
ncbi:unnamed protein product [Chrysodeixis includens]|uniref:EGF-like domain-containing protein n=1 Tax=Chrysodeixis includens TaxID=689277 RepID=A0A9P0C3A6_CHRIL|nr:unnamed protein product [Chrysodeixis includens]